jgi:peroxiredoxin
MKKTVPNVGDDAPDFEIQTADQRSLRLSSALKEGHNILLTFYRGHW